VSVIDNEAVKKSKTVMTTTTSPRRIPDFTSKRPAQDYAPKVTVIPAAKPKTDAKEVPPNRGDDAEAGPYSDVLDGEGAPPPPQQNSSTSKKP
jgi:hypothetical protein